jgi:hypothetical protein
MLGKSAYGAFFYKEDWKVGLIMAETIIDKYEAEMESED